MLDKVINEIEKMNERELEVFLKEGYERAKHILDIEYENGSPIIGFDPEIYNKD